MTTPTPAWKRLGLKLKYAKDEPDTPLTAVSTKTNGHSLEASDRPAKRRRLAKDDAAESHGQNGTHSSSSRVREPKQTEAANGSENLLTQSQQPRQRKKSVTFSDETKQDDGDSRITIDFPAGSPGSTPKRPKRAPEHSPEADSSETLISAVKEPKSTATNDQATPTKQAPKVKKGKNSKSSRSSTKDKSSLALDYLNLHRSDRDSWKFNKILDVWILNHALDSQAIPSSHAPALAGYVRGLPEKAGSRTRLVKECKEAISTSQLEADTIDTERNVWLGCVDSQKGSLEVAADLQVFLKAHSRPALLLWALNEVVAGQSGVLPAKKKSRTSAPIDISSSSESDSDSDSSDDSSDSEVEGKTKGSRNATKTVNGLTTKDETSSSGSSSSDQDSEDSSSGGASSDDSSSEDGDKK